MTRRSIGVAATLVLTLSAFFVAGAGSAAAHEERPATFPDGSGARPTFLGLDNPERRVVCQPESESLIADMDPGPLKKRNKAFLDECRFRSIQTAINSIDQRGTSIYVLPGT